VCTAVAFLVLAPAAAAQSEEALRSFFEGKRVAVKMDMPGTSDGVDVHADGGRPVDFRVYGDRLKTFGTALHAGESAIVTLVKVKKDLIEFQLSGGGFGTFGDDTSTYVYMPPVEKSNREKELERRVRDETDGRLRRELHAELDELRERRERENRRIEVEKARAEEIKKERVAERRLTAGSRFNLRYDDEVPPGIRPSEVMAALADYVDFSLVAPMQAALPEPVPSGSLLLRKGMSRAEAERALGRPIGVTERREGGETISVAIFMIDERRISAEFVEDVLVRYAITSN
jgi:hypothetical protein